MNQLNEVHYLLLKNRDSCGSIRGIRFAIASLDRHSVELYLKLCAEAAKLNHRFSEYVRIEMPDVGPAWFEDEGPEKKKRLEEFLDRDEVTLLGREDPPSREPVDVDHAYVVADPNGVSWKCRWGGNVHARTREIPIELLRKLSGSRQGAEYTVRWEIDLDADSPRRAALLALEIQRDPESIATVFDVEKGGEVVRIDARR